MMCLTLAVSLLPSYELTEYPADRDGQPYLKEKEYRVLHRVLSRWYLMPHHQAANPKPPANIFALVGTSVPAGPRQGV
jgi:hypothetical protein